MKQALFIFLAFMATGLNAQIFNAHKRALNKAERRANDMLKGGADFVIDPIEQVPSRRYASRPGAQATNWGVDLVLPADLRARMAAECKHKVLFKVMDTGNPNHRDLQQGRLAPSNYTTDASADDTNGHSTHVGGIIAGDGGLGVVDALVDKGLAQTKYVKILSGNGSGQFAWVANAIAGERAQDQAFIANGGFVVYNGSFGGGTGLQNNVEAELKRSTDAGAVFCFAAGNTGAAGVNYPGNGVYSIACASLDAPGDKRSSYSTFGPQVWAAMPGRGINSTYLNQSYASLSGTSMATPFLTAVVGVAYSKWGAALGKYDRVKKYLAWVASDLPPTGKDDYTGYGIAMVRGVLDKDPAQMPGGPIEPPPPPPNEPPTREKRTLNIALPGDWPVYWATGANESRTFKTSGRGSRIKNRSMAMKQTTITGLQIEIETNRDVSTTAKKALEATKWYFGSRGFQLPGGSDEHDAALWALYFYELILATQHPDKINIDVFGATAKTASGETFVITKANRKPYPPQ